MGKSDASEGAGKELKDFYFLRHLNSHPEKKYLYFDGWV